MDDPQIADLMSAGNPAILILERQENLLEYTIKEEISGGRFEIHFNKCHYKFLIL